MENTNQISPVITRLRKNSTLFLGAFFFTALFVSLFLYTSAKDKNITDLIGAMTFNSNRWEVLEKQQTALHEENTSLMASCDKLAKEQWGAQAECPVKKNN